MIAMKIQHSDKNNINFKHQQESSFIKDIGLVSLRL